MTTEYVRNVLTGLSLLWLIPSSFYFWAYIIKNEEKEMRLKNDKKN